MLPTIRKTRKKHKILIFRRFLTFLLALLFLSATACAPAASPDALEVLLSVAKAAQQVSAGDLYLFPDTAAPAGLAKAEAESLRVRLASKELLSAAFLPGGHSNENTDILLALQEISDGVALRLGTTASPEEYVVIRCVDRTKTNDAARLLTYRLNTLQKQYRGTEWQFLTEQGQVVVIGIYVLLIISPRAEAALDAARRVIS